MDNLIPTQESGLTIPLADKDSREVQLAFGQVYIADSSDKEYSFNNELLIKKSFFNTYTLTIILDREYLEAEDTVYPITVDPTITITASNTYDAPVYSGKPNTNFYMNEYNIVGYHNSTYGEAETFIKLDPGIIGTYMNINPEKILTANYRVYEGSGKTSSATIKLYDTDTTWTDSTITYNNKPGLIDTSSQPINISSSGWYNFNIKPLFISWLKYELGESNGFTSNYGFCLKATTANQSSRHFCSENNTSYPPCVAITYNEDDSLNEGTFFICNAASGKAMDVTGGSNTSGTNIQQYQKNNSRSQQWWVNKVSNGIYEIRPANNSNLCLDVSGGTNLDGQNIQVYSGNGTSAQRWRIIKNEDNTFRIISALGSFHSVEVVNSSSNNGANIQLYSYYGYSNQKWNFIPINPDIVSRTEWGAGQFVPNGTGDTGEIKINDVVIPNPSESQLAEFYDTIVIHHSSRDQYEQIRNLQSYEKIYQNLSDIGYHFVIDGNGVIYEGRPINKNGAHVSEKNSGKIGVCLMGNMHSDFDIHGNVHPTSEQIESLQFLIAWLDYKYSINTVCKHKDLSPSTVCPGIYAEQDLADKYIFRYPQGEMP